VGLLWLVYERAIGVSSYYCHVILLNSSFEV
jgi:hypothetical protein